MYCIDVCLFRPVSGTSAAERSASCASMSKTTVSSLSTILTSRQPLLGSIFYTQEVVEMQKYIGLYQKGLTNWTALSALTIATRQPDSISEPQMSRHTLLSVALVRICNRKLLSYEYSPLLKKKKYIIDLKNHSKKVVQAS